MGNWLLNTGWPFDTGLTGLEKKQGKETLKWRKTHHKKIVHKVFYTSLVIEEKKQRNLFTGRPHNNALTVQLLQFILTKW